MKCRSSWSLLTHCVSIALLRLCAWSFFLINGLCTGWGAPHVWGEKMGWDESKTWNRSKQTRVSALSVFRDCLAVKTWNAELSPVPKSNWAPLYPLVCLCVHAWPAALLPQTTMCYDHAARQCRQYCWMLPDCLLLTVTLFIQEEEATCAWNVCACVLPSIGVPPLDEIHHLVVMFIIANY